jgi:cell division protein FtsQ
MMTKRWFSFGKRSGGQRRRRVLPFWRTRAAVVSSSLGCAAVIVFGGWMVWHLGVPQRLVADAVHSMVVASARAGFVVHEVFVVGRTATPKPTLLDAIGVKRGAAILAIDLPAVRARIQALPWVREASVRRVLPDTVVVEIVERRPLALWQHQKKFALIDDEGQVILRDNVEAFSDLMVVVGEDAPNNATALVRMLASEPALMQRVKAAVRVGGRRWNVHLADGIDVKLPENDPQSAWRRLADYERSQGLLDKDIRTIDLRLPDRLVIRPGTTVQTKHGDNA